MSVGGVGGGGGGGGGGGAGGASGPSGGSGPSSAGKSGGDSGGGSKAGGVGGDKGPGKTGDSAAAKATGDVGKVTDTGKVDAQEQAKQAERVQAERQADKFDKSGAPTTPSDVVKNMSADPTKADGARSNIQALGSRENPNTGARGYAGGIEGKATAKEISAKASVAGIEHKNAALRVVNGEVKIEPNGIKANVNSYEAEVRSQHLDAKVRGPQASLKIGTTTDKNGGRTTGFSVGGSLHEVSATAKTADPTRGGDLTLTGEARFGQKWGVNFTNTDVDGDGRREYGVKADLGFFSVGIGAEAGDARDNGASLPDDMVIAP